MSHDRREFLGTLMALGAVPLLERPQVLSGTGGPAPRSQTQFDLSWPDRITGKHRAVFDCPEIGMGLGLLRALVWQKDYADMYGARPADLSGVVVLRHNAIWQAMNDEFWAHHKIGELTGIKDPGSGQPITRNPYFGPNIVGLPPAIADDSLRKVLDTTIVLGCNLAFQLDVVEKVKRDTGMDDARARQMALRHLIPGVRLQPSGVFAVLRAQEAGCHYILATDAYA